MRHLPGDNWKETVTSSAITKFESQVTRRPFICNFLIGSNCAVGLRGNFLRDRREGFCSDSFGRALGVVGRSAPPVFSLLLSRRRGSRAGIFPRNCNSRSPSRRRSAACGEVENQHMMRPAHRWAASIVVGRKCGLQHVERLL